MITTAPSSATGFQQTISGSKAGQQLTSRIQRTLTNPSRLGGIDFSVACEVVQNQKVVDVEVRMPPDQRHEGRACLLASDGDRNALSRGGVHGGFLALRKQVPERTWNAQVRSVGQSDS